MGNNISKRSINLMVSIAGRLKNDRHPSISTSWTHEARLKRERGKFAPRVATSVSKSSCLR